MPDYKYLDIESDELAGIISDESLIGLDTEFMRERTYFPLLCLVQISTHKRIVCADPLTTRDETDHSAVWSELLQRTWVVHSARQDIEVVQLTTGRLPREIFDTQIAAALLGLPPQMGYANMVEELFGNKLAKSHTRADWSRRPLSEAVMQYAAEDVEYLLPAYDALGERLDKLGRLDWAREDSADLLNEDLYRVDPKLAIDRVKGARNLRGQERAAAVRLAEWREQKAIDSDRPRQWIMRDPVLLEIATAMPDSKRALSATPGLAERTAQRSADRILSIVEKSRNDKISYTPPLRPTEQQKAVLKKMQNRVADCAEAVGLAAELLAPKKDLSSALAGDRQLRAFKGWRYDLVGSDLLQLLGD